MVILLIMKIQGLILKLKEESAERVTREGQRHLGK
jgi:hypothetical protein